MFAQGGVDGDGITDVSSAASTVDHVEEVVDVSAVASSSEEVLSMSFKELMRAAEVRALSSVCVLVCVCVRVLANHTHTNCQQHASELKQLSTMLKVLNHQASSERNGVAIGRAVMPDSAEYDDACVVWCRLRAVFCSVCFLHNGEGACCGTDMRRIHS